jgi:ubiquitin-protein ligase/DNA-directed RNA polymerase subunit RPC12/RpoP
MISFTCEKCGKLFNVPETYAGRTAKCKICGNMVTVPAPDGATAVKLPLPIQTSSAEPAQSPPKIPMRTRRLRADAQAMATAFAHSQIIKATPLAGDPPEAYRIHYSIESLEPGPDGKPVPRSEHEVEIQLTSDYPRLSPSCKILTPIFHPNFDASTICVGDHWTAGERLVDLVVRIGEMIAYQAYNIQSPLDGQAAMWADLNRGLLPTDQRNLQPVELE